MSTKLANFFGGFRSSRPHAPSWGHALTLGAKNRNFLKVLKTMIVGAMVLSGSLVHRLKMTELFMQF